MRPRSALLAGILLLATRSAVAGSGAKAPKAKSAEPPPAIIPDLKSDAPDAGPGQAAPQPAEKSAASPAEKAPAQGPGEPNPDGGGATAAAQLSPDGGAPTQAGPPVAKATDEQFDDALAHHFKGDFVGAASRFYAFIRGSAKTADRYEWAEHFLSLDLDQLGFKQASLDFEVAVAEERARPEVLPDALEHIEDLIDANPYPQGMVEDELIHGTDFGPLPSRPRSFVSYYQGLVDYRQGQTKWGEKRFAKVDPDSKYAAKAAYLRAVYKLIHDKDVAGAKAAFLAIASDTKAPRDLRNQSRIAVARLDYEAKDYLGSYQMYGSVELPELDPGRAGIYLERAWNLYRLKKYGDAMGLLAAVEAPSFRDVFLPDKYLLRSLVYKDLCHYLPSKRSAREFSRRYSASLKVIRARTLLADDPRLMVAALQLDDAFGKATAMKKAVDAESELIDRYASPMSDSGLATELQRMYGLLEAQAQRRYEIAEGAALKKAADRLLVEEEQLRLEDYEVGLAMYQRLKRGHIVVDAPKEEKILPDQIVYGFDGEYWNDELKDFHLFLTSRCLETEGVQ